MARIEELAQNYLCGLITAKQFRSAVIAQLCLLELADTIKLAERLGDVS